MRYAVALFATALLAGGAPGELRAQASPGSPQLEAARAALVECAALLEAGEARDASRAAYERATRAFRAAVAAEPRNPEAHAGLGETLSRCGVPHASMTNIMALIEQSTESLETALRLDPQHWQARFVLALNHFNMPAFLNRTEAAIRELEMLRAQQGTRTDVPHFALTYLYLGDAYRRAGRAADARAIWSAGAALFPDHRALQQRVTEHGGGPAGGAADAQPQPSDAPVQAPVQALSALRVEAAQHHLEDTRSSTTLRRLDIYTMPGGTGEMMQTLQSQPGATRAGDGADLYVRGGDPEETPVLLNGGRMAFVGRWEGLSGSTMGVLDATVLSRAYFSTGGFSAKYGNALSGVVDVETQGRPAAARWRTGVNLVSVGGSIYRPVSDRSGVWATATLTDVSLLARLQGISDQYPDMPRSYQLFWGGATQLTPAVELKAVGLAAGDRSTRTMHVGGHDGAFRSEGATQHGGATLRWLRGDGRAGVQASLTASRRAGEFGFGVLERRRTDHVFGTRVDADLVAAGGMRIRGGVEASTLEAVTSGQLPATRDLNPGAPVYVLADETDGSHALGAYLEVERAIASSLVGVVGIRRDRLPGSRDPTLDPRLALAFTHGVWAFRAGTGVFHQGPWRRTYRLPDGGTPAGVPTRARHAVIGAERAGEPAVRVEAYRKLYDGFVSDAAAGPAIASGASTGVDVIARWQRQERLNGWITYSALDATLGLANGERVRGRYDVTHSLTGVARYALSDVWELGSTLRYATGRPFTPVTGATAPAREGWPLEPVHGTIHGDRLPQYFRLDARITRYHRFSTGTGVFYLEMLDVNGRRNVIGYEYDASYEVRTPIESFFARRTFVLGAELNF
jgi:vitamin B12 transporter